MEDKNFAIIAAGTSKVIPEDELRKKLASGKVLTIKLGADPTAPDLHLGHAIVLRKMRQFQDMGHNVIFLIGDFTARIGDPTGRSKTRPPLTEEDIAKNTKTYFEQVSRILDPKKITIRYNSEWLGKLSSIDMINLCAKTTLAQITEREDFANRIAANQPVSLHELLYPLLQAYDSVELKADVELGGTDQTFNLMMGRHLQEQMGQAPQSLVITPLLEGLDGSAKMSKSLGNTVGLAEPADQAYGKLMSISDTLMWRYYELLLGYSFQDVEVLKIQVTGGAAHPMDLKKKMAHGIVKSFWSEQEAQSAQEAFEALFQKKDYSKAQEFDLPADLLNPVWIAELLKALGAVTTSSEVKRLVEGKAVSIDGEPVLDFKAQIAWKSGMVIKVGKHRIYQIR